ncbi:MAG: tyrosine--tRNA ligase [Candidatus Dasytiphilus stammeri]
MNTILNQFKQRTLIYQITDEIALKKRLSECGITLYCGFDPTADSLHLGHLIPLLCLKRFQNAGHKPIALIGGATGLIGDPSFKKNERKLNSTEIVIKWVKNISKQLELFLDFNCGKNSAMIVNNYTWLGKMKMIDFLRIVGKHFTINQLIHKESVKQRLNGNDLGLSFTEFTYNLLQSYDFAYLHSQYGVELQIGGSDQWGNITSGIDLTRRLHQKKVFGVTLPLITKKNGIKFGKTEDNIIWLDAHKTSPYKFYQFWRNTADTDVYRLLKLFTFMDINTIDTLEKEDQNSGEKPRAQMILAEEVTRLVHGITGLSAAKRITEFLFSTTTKNSNDMKESDFTQLAQDGIPTITIEIENQVDLQQALVKANLASSRTQARYLVDARAITINGQIQLDPSYQFGNLDKLYRHYTLLRRGKKNYCLIYWK